MTTPTTYDAVIIGSSRAAIFLSLSLAQAGKRTAMIERENLGGTCINVGCTPTKTMVASARVAYLANRAGKYGVHTGPVSVNLAEVLQRKRDLVDCLPNFPRWMIDMTRDWTWRREKPGSPRLTWWRSAPATTRRRN